MFFLLVFVAFVSGAEEFKLASPFTDHMVLQRDKPVRVWGWAEAGADVEVQLAGASVQGKAGPDGRWQVELEPLKASAEPKEMIVRAGAKSIAVKDILVGEVWLAAGQSNMDWRLATCRPGDRAVALADQLEQIRFVKVPREFCEEPRKSVDAQWVRSTEKGPLDQVSGCAYFFVRELHEKLKVPLGIIDVSFGGSHIEAWIAPDAWRLEPSLEETRKQWLAMPENNKNGASRIFNAGVNPYVGFALRGFIWHQGEGNAQDGASYKTKLRALINGYRDLWHDPQLPIGIGQLFPYQAPYLESFERLGRFCETAWAQAQAGEEIPNAGSILLSDLGDPFDIHPDEKLEQGRRYALWARARVYGETNLVYCGPIPSRVEASPEEYHIYFDHVGEGLTTRDGQDPNWLRFRCESGAQPPYRIAISPDRQFLILRKPALRGNRELALQHAWHTAAFPNLMNSAGLPATRFEIDLTQTNRFARAENKFEFPQLKQPEKLPVQQPAATGAELTMCQIFSDGMVLQRDKPVPVWGWSKPGTKITVRFADKTLDVTAGADGYWRADLPAMSANATPQTLRIATSTGKTHEIRDILVGEVWLGSGQSNMQWALHETCAKSQQAFREDELPQLRVFTVKPNHAYQPQRSVEGRWIFNQDKRALPSASGILYFFGRKLQKELGVPVGVIGSSEGGSPIRAWVPLEGLQTEPLFAEFFKQRLVAHGAEPEASGLKLERAGIGNDDAMLQPLIPYALRGFIWHQGEQDGSSGDTYRLMLHALIEGWRKAWQDQMLYVGIGQLYAFDAPYLETWKAREAWVRTQVAQYQAGKEIERTQGIVLSDLSTPYDIHPKNKMAAGERYAAWALNRVYGRDVLPGGPEPVSATRDPETGDITLTFAHVGDGLKSRDGHDVKWFQFFSPKHQQWMGLRARFTKLPNQLVLQNWELKTITDTIQIRHAWSNVAMPNLVNSAGYPASVFEMEVRKRVAGGASAID